MDTTQPALQTKDTCQIIRNVHVSLDNDLNKDQSRTTLSVSDNCVNGIGNGCSVRPKCRPNVSLHCTDEINNSVGLQSNILEICSDQESHHDTQHTEVESEISNKNCINSDVTAGNTIVTTCERVSDSRALPLEPEDGEKQSVYYKTSSKSERIKTCIQNSVSEDAKKKIEQILNDVSKLSDVEKLLLYLQLPAGVPSDVDPLKQKNPGNPLGKKAEVEVAQTFTWIKTHLEEDPDVSLPKQEVYEEYRVFCEANKIEALCAADFGKVMKHVLPSVKPRRLGTRGNSRYCYSGLRKKLLVDTPMLPELDISGEVDTVKIPKDSSEDDHCSTAACHLLFEWAEKLLNKKFSSVRELAYFLVENMYVDNRSVAAFTVLSSGCGSNSEKGQTGLLKHISGSRRKETQMHLQRKLQEKELIKEQKRKLQEQRALMFKAHSSKSSLGKKSSGISSKWKSGSPSSSLEKHYKLSSFGDMETDTIKTEQLITLNSEYGDLDDELKRERHKSEPCTKSTNASSVKEERALSVIGIPENSDEEKSKSASGNTNKDCFETVQSLDEASKRLNKLPIPRNNSSVCITQAMPSIIIVPSTFSHQVQVQSQCGQSCQKSNVWKYKKIQPKPMSGRTRLGSSKFKRNLSVLRCNIQNKDESHQKQDVELASNLHLSASSSEKCDTLCKPSTYSVGGLCDDNQKADELVTNKVVSFTNDASIATPKTNDVSKVKNNKMENDPMSCSQILPFTCISSTSMIQAKMNQSSISGLEDHTSFDENAELKFHLDSVKATNNIDLELFSELSQQTVKRHFEENEPLIITSKKPHLESQKNETEKSEDESCLPWSKLESQNCTEKTFDNKNTELVELGNIYTPKNRGIIKQTDNEEVSIHELESDALMEYLQEKASYFSNPAKSALVPCTSQSLAAHSSTFNLLSKECSSNQNNQLSQLRMLLEKNLPHTVTRGVGNTRQSFRSAKVIDNPNNANGEDSIMKKDSYCGNFSELRQALLRPAISNPTIHWKQSYKGRKTANKGNGVLLGNQMKHLEKLSDTNVISHQTSVEEQEIVPCFPGLLNNKLLSQSKTQNSHPLTNSQEQHLDQTVINSNLDDIQNEVDLSINDIKLENQFSGDLASFAHMHSVPPSPNTRRRAFNFLPISPHQTPYSDIAGTPISASPVPSQGRGGGGSGILTGSSIGASGTSQPPSAASSPFVSPNSTPIPWTTRSRHNSGQTSYGTARHTPFQNMDSGVSSVTNSPFVSPHATPAPVSRLRHNSSQSQGKTVTFSAGPIVMHTQTSHLGHIMRSRHSSGPGGPPSLQPAISQLAAPRSAPMSPMIGENSSQDPFNFCSLGGTPTIRSRHNSSSSLNPLSPVTGPLSPNEHVKTEFLSFSSMDLASETQNADQPMAITVANEDSGNLGLIQDNVPATLQSQEVFSWNPEKQQLSALDESDSLIPSQTGWPSVFSGKNNQLWSGNRQRHVSGSVLNHHSANGTVSMCDSLSQEVQNFLKNSPQISIGNRSHSVPPHQMVQNLLDQYGNSELSEENFSKSYPVTPVVNQSFSFPSSSLPHSMSNLHCHEDELTTYRNIVLSDSLSQQDPLQTSVSQDSKWNSFGNGCDNMEEDSTRKSVNDLLDDRPLEDDLQATLEDLRACDDFSQFAEELEEDFKDSMGVVI
ncbi:uncharacterized protein LOC106478835 [Limulus polyphemus]|uniref:Uncharacterized protein LOC106478835 n=1 Tax=Limulus polyphemus TaxID=6850 RepID=A0ABM1S3L1_LIMPO|nr:uncharacterized protein LOC106478835 [Limulus polyphemus]